MQTTVNVTFSRDAAAWIERARKAESPIPTPAAVVRRVFEVGCAALGEPLGLAEKAAAMPGVDPWVSRVRAWLEERKDQRLPVSEVLSGALGIPKGLQSRADTMRAAAALRLCGWGRLGQRQTHAPRSWLYARAGQ